MDASHIMIVDFNPNGSVQGMHRDQFPLGFLGKQSITRASDIRHDSESDTWEVTVAVGSSFVSVEGASGFATYEEARKMEVRWFEMCRLHSIAPTSPEGVTLLYTLRKKFD